MSSELKLVVEKSEGATVTKPDLATMNPVDALNRRDIELIKKSLVGMHRDNTDLRNTMIAIHERNSSVPSKSFFLAMGLVGLLAMGALTVARPHLSAALQQVPLFAHLANNLALH